MAEIKTDMQRPRPMDRLICGDVGYGKTELAIRAAFKAIDNGQQVAVLVPTTVLAEQHYRTFSQRLAEYPVHRRMPEPLPHRRRAGRIVERLAKGGVDVIIGTHRLLSADVQFKDLGLVIIDEEQRFGVEHKDRLKQLRTEVDVLTMTATPIPRTLHLSLLGIRDISNLETPPPDRLAIETRIVRFDPQLIRNAILRELNREGQIYFVHNRVHNIQEIADRLKQIVPEARLAVVHGQMAERRAGSRRCCGSCAARPTFWWRRRSSRAAWTSPTPTPSSSTRPTTTAWPTCTSCAAASAVTSTGPTPTCCWTATADHADGGAAAEGDRGVYGAGRRLQDRHARPGDPRRRQHPRHPAERPHRGGRLRDVLPAAGERGAQLKKQPLQHAAGGDGRSAVAGVLAARLRGGAAACGSRCIAGWRGPQPGPAGRFPPGAARPLRPAAGAGRVAAAPGGVASAGDALAGGTVHLEKPSEGGAPTDVVLGYRNGADPRAGGRSRGRLVVVDDKSAYFRLRPAETEALAMYKTVKGLLRV